MSNEPKVEQNSQQQQHDEIKFSENENDVRIPLTEGGKNLDFYDVSYRFVCLSTWIHSNS